jgi:hypothetical protein
MKSGRWAARTVDNRTAPLVSLQGNIPVRLIATPRSAFKTCLVDEDLSKVIEGNEENFDYLPVVERSDGNDKEHIIGLLEVIEFMHGAAPVGLVRNHMRPLSEENLIGADASILAFIRNADRQMCRLVVSGPEIDGLVSLSDLQRLPVRAALFAMVTYLEMTMVEAIRSEFNECDDWMNRLSSKRRSEVRAKAAAAKVEDTFVDELLYTEFCDKVTIIRKKPDFPGSRRAFDNDLRKIQSLRDNLAHANNYAATRDDAADVCETVRLMDRWIEWLTT